MLKKKAHENEFIIKKDERVKKLEAQVAWFRKEALYWNQLCQDKVKEIALLKEQNTCLDQEKNHFEDLF